MYEPLKCENCGKALPWSNGWRQPSHYVADTWTDPGYWDCDRETESSVKGDVSK